jgi:hypothetical protein
MLGIELENLANPACLSVIDDQTAATGRHIIAEYRKSAPRIARLLALAHKLNAMAHSGEIADYAQLARLGHISSARDPNRGVLHLAPAIQEYILFLSAADARFITELGLRKIAREPRWDRQRELFELILKN